MKASTDLIDRCTWMQGLKSRVHSYLDLQII